MALERDLSAPKVVSYVNCWENIRMLRGLMLHPVLLNVFQNMRDTCLWQREEETKIWYTAGRKSPRRGCNRSVPMRLQYVTFQSVLNA